MSEYWKSTPKYWCKFCSDYVKDTKFERQQHEATGRHQGNIQRQLKGLHREQANQAREKQRAKDEVARLNGLVPSSAVAGGGGSGGGGGSVAGGVAGNTPKPRFAKPDDRKATLQDRKRQWEQLAAMGLAVPDEASKGKTVKGEWTVLSEKVVGEVGADGVVKEIVSGEGALSTGVRKRKVDEDEEERVQAEELVTKKKGWGHTLKKFPGSKGSVGDEDDLDTLFSGSKKPKIEEVVKEEVKEEAKAEDASISLQDIPTEAEAIAHTLVKQEQGKSTPAVVFKKRKKIAK